MSDAIFYIGSSSLDSLSGVEPLDRRVAECDRRNGERRRPVTLVAVDGSTILRPVVPPMAWDASKARPL